MERQAEAREARLAGRAAAHWRTNADLIVAGCCAAGLVVFVVLGGAAWNMSSKCGGDHSDASAGASSTWVPPLFRGLTFGYLPALNFSPAHWWCVASHWYRVVRPVLLLLVPHGLFSRWLGLDWLGAMWVTGCTAVMLRGSVMRHILSRAPWLIGAIVATTTASYCLAADRLSSWRCTAGACRGADMRPAVVMLLPFASLALFTGAGLAMACDTPLLLCAHDEFWVRAVALARAAVTDA